LLLVHSVLRFGILFQQTSLAVVRYGRIFYITAADCAGVHHVSRSPALLGAIMLEVGSHGLLLLLICLTRDSRRGSKTLGRPKLLLLPVLLTNLPASTRYCSQFL
jgi:hypothetical protein